jgi:hypothetical protein
MPLGCHLVKINDAGIIAEEKQVPATIDPSPFPELVNPA